MEKVKASEVLIRAKELISKPGAWIRWFSMGYGKQPAGNWNDGGHPVNIHNGGWGREANQFCATGAINYTGAKMSAHDAAHRANAILHEVAPSTAKRLGRPLSGERAKYKFGRTHAGAHYNNTSLEFSEVNELFCDAIKVAVEEEQNADD